MNIEDIRKLLENDLLKLINLNHKNPSRLRNNKIIINKFLLNNNEFTKTEIIYLLKNKNNLENLHIFCPFCGKKNIFNNLKHGYSQYCCAKHANISNRDKAKQTWKRIYGVDNPNKCRKVREKIESTNLKNCGYKCNWSSKDPKLNGKATCKQKYGVENCFASKDPKLNGRATCKERYGNEYYTKTQRYKDLFKDKERNKKIQEKIYNTKKKNNSFNNRSKQEIRCFELLKTKFPDAEHSYRDEKRYPFNCDVYIPSKDLFIEFHFGFAHGSEPFDLNNQKHLQEIERCKIKQNETRFDGKKKKSYAEKIKVWTESDPLKLKTFIDNKLNFKIFYTEKEFLKWFKTL